jgi:hypothetical protein
MRRITLAFAVAAAATVAVPAALATPTPDKGEVSKDKPTTSWTGQVFGPYQSAAAPPPDQCALMVGQCEIFKLTVKVGESPILDSELNFKMQPGDPTTPSQDIDMYVYDPHGKKVGQSTGAAADENVTVPTPDGGEWQIMALGSTGGGGYKVTATLTIPPTGAEQQQQPGATPEGPPNTSPSTQPPANPPPPVSPAGGRGTSSANPVKLKLNFARFGGSAKKLSAKKVLKIKVRASEKVTNLTAELQFANKRGTVFARGQLKSLNGKGTLTLRLNRKLVKGKYKLIVFGRNARGQIGKASANLRFS